MEEGFAIDEVDGEGKRERTEVVGGWFLWGRAVIGLVPEVVHLSNYLLQVVLDGVQPTLHKLEVGLGVRYLDLLLEDEEDGGFTLTPPRTRTRTRLFSYSNGIINVLECIGEGGCELDHFHRRLI